MDTFKINLAVFLDPVNWFIFVFAGSLIAPNTEVLALLGLSLWVPIFLKVYRKDYPPLEVLFQSEIKLLILFFLYILVSLLWSPMNSVLISKEVVRVFVSVALVLSFLYWIRSGAANNIAKIDDFLILCVAVSAFVLTVPIVNAMLLESVALESNVFRESVVGVGIFYHHETVAWFFGLGFLLVSARFIEDQNENWMGLNKVIHLSVLSVSLVLISFLLILSQSGATFFGVVLALLYQFIFLPSKYKFHMSVVVAFLVFFVLMTSIFLDIPIATSNFSSTEVDRFYVWRQGLDLISDAQFFGHGFGASSITESASSAGSQSMHLHNAYLSVLFYGGITGLFIFIALIFSVFSNNWGRSESKVWFSIWLMGLVIFFFDGNHIVTYLSSELYVFLLPVAVLVALRVRRKLNG